MTQFGNTLLVLICSAFLGCSVGGSDGAIGPQGDDGADCFDSLVDQDGDGELTSADCLWAALCPAPIAQLNDINGDGAVTVADCREALRGPAGEQGADGLDGPAGEAGPASGIDWGKR